MLGLIRLYSWFLENRLKYPDFFVLQAALAPAWSATTERGSSRPRRRLGGLGQSCPWDKDHPVVGFASEFFITFSKWNILEPLCQATQLVELDREVATGLRKLEDEDLSTEKRGQEEEQTKDTETIGNVCENMTTEIPDEKKD